MTNFTWDPLDKMSRIADQYVMFIRNGDVSGEAVEVIQLSLPSPKPGDCSWDTDDDCVVGPQVDVYLTYELPENAQVGDRIQVMVRVAEYDIERQVTLKVINHPEDVEYFDYTIPLLGSLEE